MGACRGDLWEHGRRAAGVRGASPPVLVGDFVLRSLLARCGLAGGKFVAAGNCLAVWLRR